MGGAIPLCLHGEGRDDFTFAFKAISLPVFPPPSLSIIMDYDYDYNHLMQFDATSVYIYSINHRGTRIMLVIAYSV